jgi:hypothetical protein
MHAYLMMDYFDSKYLELCESRAETVSEKGGDWALSRVELSRPRTAGFSYNENIQAEKFLKAKVGGNTQMSRLAQET